MQFLIDECLSAELTQVTPTHGHTVEHVAVLNLKATADADIFAYACDRGLVLVTANRKDFEPLAWLKPGHPGLVFMPGTLGLKRQSVRFAAVLKALSAVTSLQDRALTITSAGKISIHPCP